MERGMNAEEAAVDLRAEPSDVARLARRARLSPERLKRRERCSRRSLRGFPAARPPPSSNMPVATAIRWARERGDAGPKPSGGEDE